MSITSTLKKMSSGAKKKTTSVYINRKISNVEGTAKKQLLDKMKTEKLKDVAASHGIKLTRWDDDVEKWVPMTNKSQIVKKMASKMKYDTVIDVCKRYKIPHKQINEQVKNEKARIRSKSKA